MEGNSMVGRIRVKDFSALSQQLEGTEDKVLLNDLNIFFTPEEAVPAPKEEPKIKQRAKKGAGKSVLKKKPPKLDKELSAFSNLFPQSSKLRTETPPPPIYQYGNIADRRISQLMDEPNVVFSPGQALIDQIVEESCGVSQSGLNDNHVSVDMFNPETESFESQSQPYSEEGLSIRIENCQSLAPQQQSASKTSSNDAVYVNAYQNNVNSESVFNRSSLDFMGYQNRNYSTSVNIDSTAPVHQPSTNIVFSGGTAVLVNSFPQSTHVQMPHNAVGSTFIVHNPGSVASPMKTTVQPNFIDSNDNSGFFGVLRYDDMGAPVGYGDGTSQYRVVGQTSIDKGGSLPQYRSVSQGTIAKDGNLPQYRSVSQGTVDKDSNLPQYRVVGQGAVNKGGNLPQYRVVGRTNIDKDGSLPQYRVVGQGNLDKESNLSPYRVVGQGNIDKESNLSPYRVVGQGNIDKESNLAPYRVVSQESVEKESNPAPYRVVGHGNIDKESNLSLYRVVGKGNIDKESNLAPYRVVGQESVEKESNPAPYRVVGHGNIDKESNLAPYPEVGQGGVDKESSRSQYRVIGQGSFDKDSNMSQYRVLGHLASDKSRNVLRYQVPQEQLMKITAEVNRLLPKSNVQHSGLGNVNKKTRATVITNNVESTTLSSSSNSPGLGPNSGNLKKSEKRVKNTPASNSLTEMSNAHNVPVVPTPNSLLKTMLKAGSSQINPGKLPGESKKTKKRSSNRPSLIESHIVSAVQASADGLMNQGNIAMNLSQPAQPSPEISSVVPNRYANSDYYLYNLEKRNAMLKNIKASGSNTVATTAGINLEKPVAVQNRSTEYSTRKSPVRSPKKKDLRDKSPSKKSGVGKEQASVQDCNQTDLTKKSVPKKGGIINQMLKGPKKTGSNIEKIFSHGVSLPKCYVLLHRIDIDGLQRMSQLKNKERTSSEQKNKEDEKELSKETAEKKKLKVKVPELMQSKKKEILPTTKENDEQIKTPVINAPTSGSPVKKQEVQLQKQSTKKKKGLEENVEAAINRVVEEVQAVGIQKETIESKNSIDGNLSSAIRPEPVKSKKKKADEPSGSVEKPFDSQAVLSFMKDFGKQSNFPCLKCDREMPTSHFWVNAKSQELLCQICIVKSYALTAWDDAHREDLIGALLFASNTLISVCNEKRKEHREVRLLRSGSEVRRPKTKAEVKEMRNEDDGPKPKRIRRIESDSDSST